MLQRTAYFILGMALMSASSWAQTQALGPQTYAPTTPRENQMYCSGVVTTKVQHDSYVISGAESSQNIVFSSGDEVFINKGSGSGVKVGDVFLVTREETDPLRYPWFVPQQDLERAMGTYVADIARIRVVNVQQKTAVAEIVNSCDFVQRGDMIETFAERPAPTLKPVDAKFDLYAAATGKPKAMVVFGQNYASVTGAGRIVYINLGSGQGVKVGDYFRIFHYQDQHRENAYAPDSMSYRVYGLGSTPRPYSGDDLPRDILGEGVVLRVGPNAATVFITVSQQAIFAGDYVEME
jgi:hypothetical protein